MPGSVCNYRSRPPEHGQRRRHRERNRQHVTVTAFQLLSGQAETPTQLTHLSICQEAEKPNTRPLG